jgi:hypothetical protein
MKGNLEHNVVITCCLLLLACRASSQEVAIRKFTIDPNNIANIEVDAREDFYYLLKVKHHLHEPFSHFTAMVSGENGIVTLKETIGKYPIGHYQVLAYRKSNPADSDGDGADDLTEFLNPVNQSPFNAAKQISFKDGAVHIPNRDVFKKLSYQGEAITDIDQHLKDLEFIKFYIVGDDPKSAQLYFMNSNTHKMHASFKLATHINTTGGFGEIPLEMKGEIVFHPNIKSANGTLGVYRFQFEPNDSFSFNKVQMAFELIGANMPFLKNNLAYYPMPNAALPLYHEEKKSYDLSRIPILLEEDLFADIDYMALNQAEGYGFLRKMEYNAIPGIRDIVIYENLPNEMPRTGGIISAVPQTPLSHVNLRAIQDKVPNAYIKDPGAHEKIANLIGKYVHYVVKQNEFIIEESSQEMVNAWFDAIRPKENQIPPLNLSRTKITRLDAIRFDMSDSFGAKCANLAEMRTFGFDDLTIPDGFGIPFQYYRAFMNHNGFYDKVLQMRSDSLFIYDATERDKQLKIFRKLIEKGEMPQWMLDDLAVMQNSFPKGESIRCRSSTNNEDLPNFSGAGLYDSKTQKPDEGHISKSIKQIYASMWNFRAYDEREFYRIDHMAASMGVLCHPNEKDEILNGVGVTADPIYFTDNTFYLNNQIGEDLVTNPEALSIPEEIILDAGNKTKSDFTVVRYSSLSNSKLILDEKYLSQMRDHLKIIHNRFKKLYQAENDPYFAIEIEYKIVKEGYLSIKQARPWLGTNTSSGVDFYNEEEHINLPVFHFFAYPNPFEGTVNFKFESKEGGSIRIELYLLNGIKILDKSLGYKLPGVHEEPLDLAGLVSMGAGIIAKISLDGQSQQLVKTTRIFKK